jgi:hypothetical protein
VDGLEQIWSSYRGQRNKQQQGRRPDKGVLHSAQNAEDFLNSSAFYEAALTDEEFGAAAAVNPDSTAVGTPGSALDAGRAADLPAEADVATSADVTPVSATVVGGAGDDLRGWRLRGAKATAATDGEFGAAAAVNPETAAIDAPGSALNAGRAADLADELSVASAADVAPVSAAVIRGTVDGLTGRGLRWARGAANDELGAAATVDPEATVVDAPGSALNAGRATDLADDLSIASATNVAPVSAAVVGGAGDALCMGG